MSLLIYLLLTVTSGKRKLITSLHARHFQKHWLNLLHLSKTHFKNSSSKIRGTEQRLLWCEVV